MERYTVRFVGHVQGRGFRWACWNCAHKAGVTGWVRNERDGTVTAEVQGEPTQIRDFYLRLEDLVDDYGSGWSRGASRGLPLVADEAKFVVR